MNHMQRNASLAAPCRIRYGQSGTTWTRGKYSVTVGADGSIRVKTGDSLCKYSAAIFGDLWTVEYFYRKDSAGNHFQIPNPHWIKAGEIIYYVPTHSGTVNERHFAGMTMTASLPSDLEKKRIACEHFKKIYTQPDYVEIIGKAFLLAHNATELVEIMEVLSRHVGAFAWVTEGVGDTASGLGLFLFPIHAFIDIFNSWEATRRAVSLRGRAYGITAWVFGDPPPQPPSYMRADVISQASGQKALAANPGDRDMQAWVKQFTAYSQVDANRLQSYWNEGVQSALDDISRWWGQINWQISLGEGQCKGILRDLNDNDPNKLLMEIMKEMADDLADGERSGFWAPPPRYKSE
jgi:hypothetical protein